MTQFQESSSVSIEEKSPGWKYQVLVLGVWIEGCLSVAVSRVQEHKSSWTAVPS